MISPFIIFSSNIESYTPSEPKHKRVVQAFFPHTSSSSPPNKICAKILTKEEIHTKKFYRMKRDDYLSCYIKLVLPPISVPPCPDGISPFLPTTNSR